MNISFIWEELKMFPKQNHFFFSYCKHELNIKKALPCLEQQQKKPFPCIFQLLLISPLCFFYYFLFFGRLFIITEHRPKLLFHVLWSEHKYMQILNAHRSSYNFFFIICSESIYGNYLAWYMSMEYDSWKNVMIIQEKMLKW